MCVGCDELRTARMACEGVPHKKERKKKKLMAFIMCIRWSEWLCNLVLIQSVRLAGCVYVLVACVFFFSFFFFKVRQKKAGILAGKKRGKIPAFFKRIRKKI